MITDRLADVTGRTPSRTRCPQHSCENALPVSFYSERRAVVIGGFGFIGVNLIERLRPARRARSRS